jgi:glycosyltransferase involved in cell wall biosynthesis
LTIEPFQASGPEPLRVTLIIPLRDDWLCAEKLIRRIDTATQSSTYAISIILIDDGSLQKCDAGKFSGPFSAVRAIRVLRLRRNLGHQRAIAIGLAYTRQTNLCDAVAVMDADGEDTPEGLVRLLQAFSQNGGATAIFAERSKRSESILFRFFYQTYRALHWSLTGVSVRVGNFSILPARYLNTIVVLSELWNHYAAAVFRSKLPSTMIPIARGQRISGKSTMNFVALVSHGLSAISVFGDIVGVRLMIAALAGSFMAGVGIVIVIAIRLFTTLAVPGWATYVVATLVVIMIQLISTATSFTFFTLSSRTNLGFIPLRDYSLFVEDTQDVYSR